MLCSLEKGRFIYVRVTQQENAGMNLPALIGIRDLIKEGYRDSVWIPIRTKTCSEELANKV